MIEVSQRAESDFGAAADVSAGTLLRRAREAAGLHVAALAVSLKVPVRKLEALEEDRFDLLPDTVFVRGLASSVCRTLKIDPQPVLERLPQSSAPRLVQNSDGLNTPFRAPGDGAPPGWIDHVRRPVFLAVFALLLGALVLIFLPGARDDRSPAVTTAHAATTVEPAVTQPPVPQQPPAVELPSPAAAPAQSSAAAVPAVASSTPSSPAAVAAAPAVVAPVQKPAASAATASASAPTAAPAAAAAAAGLVVMRARGESWIEVIDATGVVVARKTLVAGESASASGALPLQVTIGRADVTDVLVRNKPFDMRSVSRDNVARFEVK